MTVAKAQKNEPPVDTETWLNRLNSSNHVLWLLFILSFLETIILPIPIELILLPFMIVNRHRLWISAAVVTCGCLTASLVGYGIGFFVYETFGQWIVSTMSWQQQYEQFRQLFEVHGFLAILMVGVLPIPFQIAMLAAGAAGYAIWYFTLAATIARGIRYFGLALLVFLFGKKAKNVWETNKAFALLVLAAITITLWVAAKGFSSFFL